MYKICQKNIYEIAIPFIKQQEGLVLNVYKDEAKFNTIGYGHKLLANEAHLHTITLQEAEDILKADLQICFKCLNNNLTISLTNLQFASLLSFVFNVGITAFASSTMLRLINNQQLDLAAAEFLKWVYVTKGGKKVISNTLLCRRKYEQRLFLSK
ncbi:lysozyme [Rickettsiales bacterium LUAb2]